MFLPVNMGNVIEDGREQRVGIDLMVNESTKLDMIFGRDVMTRQLHIIKFSIFSG